MKRFLHSLLAAVLAGLLTFNASSAHAAPGDLDPFNAAVVGTEVGAAAVQPDGKMVIGGNFTSVLGVPRNYIARINADGKLDTGFNPNANDYVSNVAVQSDGKILLVGSFTAVGGNARNYIARLNSNGTLDAGFNPNASNFVGSAAVQADGKILIGGLFSAVGGTSRTGIARLNSNGTLDAGFNLNANGSTYMDRCKSSGMCNIPK